MKQRWKSFIRFRIIFRPDPRIFLLKTMPKNSVCAEIGVWKGDFSTKILKYVKPMKLHLIDPWKYEDNEIYERAKYGRGRIGSQNKMDEIYDYVKRRMKKDISTAKVVIHRSYSDEASINFPNEYFDWIYIDGNHLYDYVKKDLELYYPKIKTNGFITGDDYEAKGTWWQGGVKKAVDEFVEAGCIKLITLKKGQFILQKC